MNSHLWLWKEGSAIDGTAIWRAYKDYEADCKHPYRIRYSGRDGTSYTRTYGDENERDAEFEILVGIMQRNVGNDVVIEKGVFGMGALKGYFERHQDQLITLGIIILLDHILFDGMFRARIKGMIEKLLGATERKLVGEE